MSELTIFGSIAGAIVAWAAAEWWREEPVRARDARAAWTCGAALMALHSVAAFLLLYDGSHATAVAATARQTAALMGIASGWGIYVNYAFNAVWLGDAAWWWIAPASYVTRPRVISTVRRAFFLFMFVNGAVIFADGWMRVLGGTAVTIAAIAWARDCRRRYVARLG
jgi:hypothetical protein